MSRTETITQIINHIHQPDFSGEFTAIDLALLNDALSSRAISYYDLLAVQNSASFKTKVIENYHLLVMRYHPDKTVGKPDQAIRTDIFKLIQNACETLADIERKQRYDAERRRARTQNTAQDASSRNETSNLYNENRDFEVAKAILKNDETFRMGILNNPEKIMNFAREGRWGFVRCILILFRDMLDRNLPDCFKTFPGPGHRDNSFYTVYPEKAPTPVLTEFTRKFRDPLIFLLKESVRNPAATVFCAAFSVLQATSLWAASDLLVDPNNRDILDRMMEKFDDRFGIADDFKSIFGTARSIEALLAVLDEAQRDDLCHDMISHVRYVISNDVSYLSQINLSSFSKLFVHNLSLVLTYKAIVDYETEKQAQACCCNSFFFSWKSSGSKALFYALKEITEKNHHYIHWSNPTGIIWFPSPEQTFGELYRSIHKALLDHGAEVGPHFLRVLQKYQLLDTDHKPSNRLFSENFFCENTARRNPFADFFGGL